MNVPVPAPEFLILALDDKVANLVELERALSGLPVRLMRATSREAALSLASSHHFGLAILDVQMPGTIAWELAGSLQGATATDEVPIIFVSAAFGGDSHLLHGYHEGAIDYLVRPFDPAILISKVRVFLLLPWQRNELERSEQRYRSLFRGMHNGLSLHHAEAVGAPSLAIAEVNPAFERLTGLSGHDLDGKSPQAAFGLSEAAAQQFHACAASGGDLRDFVLEGLPGKYFSLRFFAPDSSLVACVWEDVSELVRLEHERNRAQRRMSSWFDQSPIPIAIVDREGTFLAASRMISETLRAPAVGRTYSQLLPASSVPLFHERLEQVAQTNETLRVQEVSTTAHGAGVFETCIFPVAQETDEEPLYGIVSVDITELVEAEIALKQNEQRLAAVLMDQQEMVCRFLPDTTLTYVNEAFCANYQRSEASLLGTPLFEFVGIEASATLRKNLEALRSGSVNIASQHRIVAPDGTIVWQEWLDHAIFDVAGHLLEVQSTGRDITEQKLGEEKILEINRQLEASVLVTKELAVQAEEANRAKSIFLANMSHEIRTPLNSILGFAQILKRDASLTAKQTEHLETINRSGEHLLQLINDILDMAKIEAGKARLESVEFDLAFLFTYLQNLFGLRLGEKGLSLRVSVSAELPPFAQGDLGKVRQILVNLLSNAVKFTERGGVTVEASTKPRDGGTFLLTVDVEDTGPGISEDDQEGIFGEFTQAVMGRRIGGTGLGLAISRRYAQLMGGELSVVSQVGVGSRFRLEVPLLKGDLGPDDGAEAKEVVGLAPGTPLVKLLLVDDKPENLSLLYELLTPLGFALKGAENGATGLELAAAWRPDGILLDMRMPVMDGYEMARRVRAEAWGKDIFILALSASAFEDEAAATAQAGADAYLSKPFRTPDLLSRIAEGLGVHYSYGSSARGFEEEENALPTALAGRILKATDEGDIAQLQNCEDKLRSTGHPGSDRLRRLLESFDYEGIRTWLESSVRQPSKGGTS